MAFKIGAQANFQIKDSGGTLRDISPYVTSIDFDRTADAPETSVFGVVAKQYIPGLQDTKITVAADFDPTLVGYLDGLMTYQGTATTLQTYQWAPQGTATGSLKYTGSAIITDYKPSAPVAGVVTTSVSFQGSGTVTQSTF